MRRNRRGRSAGLEVSSLREVTAHEDFFGQAIGSGDGGKLALDLITNPDVIASRTESAFDG